VSGDEWLGFWPLCQSVSSQTSGIHLWQFCIAVKWQQVEVDKQKGANESTVGNGSRMITRQFSQQETIEK
jgi:hypothetical protein